MGKFSLATEAGWSAAFELKKGGVAIVIPSFDAENEDGSTNSKSKVQHIKATWKEVKNGIEIAYLDHRDQFRIEQECHEWEEHPCFRYEKSTKGPEDKSHLKYDPPYINWNWKNLVKPKVIPKIDSNKCKTDCEKMRVDGVLKEGMSLEQCIKTICKLKESRRNLLENRLNFPSFGLALLVLKLTNNFNQKFCLSGAQPRERNPS